VFVLSSGKKFLPRQRKDIGENKITDRGLSQSQNGKTSYLLPATFRENKKKEFQHYVFFQQF